MKLFNTEYHTCITTENQNKKGGEANLEIKQKEKGRQLKPKKVQHEGISAFKIKLKRRIMHLKERLTQGKKVPD